MAKQKRHSADVSRSRELKNVPLNIRVAATEKAAFERAAEIAGIALSSWIRERLRSAALRELDNVREAAPFLAAARD
jgi:uncharacterized protein (DUF1778 family)